MRDPETIDLPAAPLEESDRTPAQERCELVPLEECKAYKRCQDCPAYFPPTNRSRA